VEASKRKLNQILQPAETQRNVEEAAWMRSKDKDRTKYMDKNIDRRVGVLEQLLE
jgi:hypothetical protein